MAFPSDSTAGEPDFVGPVGELAAAPADGEPGAVRLSWTAAEHAQAYFVAAVKSADALAGNFAGARMTPFSDAGGVIGGLEPGAGYHFTAVGMRWNWVEYGAVWGQWCEWVTATAAPLPAPTNGETAGRFRQRGAGGPPPLPRLPVSRAPAGGAAAAVRSETMADVRSETTPETLPGSTGGDRAALVALYDAAGGAGWHNRTGWLTDAPVGEWYGVTADAGGRVTGLQLGRNGLAGVIPAALGDLGGLTRLSLWENRLTGSIPPELGRLSRLVSLSLRSNRLTGAIPPELGDLTGLTRLYLYDNLLTGEIPDTLGNLAELQWFSLNGNLLTGGHTAGTGAAGQFGGAGFGPQPAYREYPAGAG